eukprot:TRINITY_DN4395_c0_g1_i1.p1 TRINITY_DN4395_c0_g1~~TRINITY_DN4395_c0_g1_i1.p1  ORF type:complete len:349 (-),score=75.10 TRINITY_DN4395_c0_g1_i1:49-1095(-)
MDAISSTPSVISTHKLSGNLALLALALSVWLLERRTRLGGLPLVYGGLGQLRSLAPELAGLAACGMIAGSLIYRKEHNGLSPIPAEDQKLWQDINTEWPILMTADSLLGLQAMLRMVLLSSAVLRSTDSSASPFTNEPALFFFLAAACRVTLLAVSPPDVYHLDGPLGGALNLALEVLAVPLLAFASRHVLAVGLRRLSLCFAGILAAFFLSTCNRLALADPGAEQLDVLFSLAKLLESLAALAFLARTCSLGRRSSGRFTSFAHALLPVQQCLGTYFMLTAWGAAPLQEVPELVGAGSPFALLQTTGIAEAGLYLLSLVAFVASRSAVKEQGLVSSEDIRQPLYIEV